VSKLEIDLEKLKERLTTMQKRRDEIRSEMGALEAEQRTLMRWISDLAMGIDHIERALPYAMDGEITETSLDWAASKSNETATCSGQPTDDRS